MLMTLRRWIIDKNFIKDVKKNPEDKIIKYFDNKYPYKAPAPIKKFQEFLADVIFLFNFP